ncbi:GNAT family N-acetyltransferase [Aestuariispira insulae]|uniref:RimJ/RimL family protein N-acetyltransferase n=1 Tax=Aestuariispira insulae TaxID=1461337 RepID=A0A3D9HX28_9PROT|nr:GNAT family N-acetyltransferase [Aestuariispira insulae]RED53941.1 RimJ/RimL family protein N-acetyltransferase [Aestuariispira insulae]
MQPSLTTERLILTPRTLDDLDDCIAMDRDQEVRRHITPEFRDNFVEADYRQTLRDRISNSHYPDGLGCWTIRKRAPGQAFVGIILLLPVGDIGPETEIGWRLRKDQWGLGFATEAAKALLHHAFMELALNKILCLITPENKRSLSVARKLGFTADGTRQAWGSQFDQFTLSNL